MTKDRVDERLFRAFIPEENRGGTYHVVLLLNDKLVGPLTPDQANQLGWTDDRIGADIAENLHAEMTASKGAQEKAEAERDAAQAAEVDAVKAHNEMVGKANAEIARLTEALAEATAQRDTAQATVEAQSAHIAAFTKSAAKAVSKKAK